MLGATVVAVLVWMPDTTWSQVLHEVRASSLYVQNWVLAGSDIDYLTPNTPPTITSNT